MITVNELYLCEVFSSVVGSGVGLFIGWHYNKTVIKALRQSNSSLIADLNTGLTITTSQRDEYNRIVQEHKVLNEQQNEIIVYLRYRFPTMLDGRYSSFSALVIAILKGKQ